MRMRHICRRMWHVRRHCMRFKRGFVLHMSLNLRHPLPEMRRSIRMPCRMHMHTRRMRMERLDTCRVACRVV